MKRTWSDYELDESWSLTADESAFLVGKTARNRLAFALLFKFFQLENRFPENRNEIPPQVIKYVAGQIGVNQKHLDGYTYLQR